MARRGEGAYHCVPELDEDTVGERFVREVDAGANWEVGRGAGRLDERGQAGHVVGLDMGLEDAYDPTSYSLGLLYVRVD